MKKISIFILLILWFNISFAYTQNNIETKINNIFLQKDKQFNLKYKTPYYICLNEQKYYTNITNLINKVIKLPKYRRYINILNIIKTITQRRENICNLNIHFQGKPYFFSYKLDNNFKNISAWVFSLIINKKIFDFFNRYETNKKINSVINNKNNSTKTNPINTNKIVKTTTETKTIIEWNKKITTTTIITTTIINWRKTTTTRTNTKITYIKPINTNSNTQTQQSNNPIKTKNTQTVHSNQNLNKQQKYTQNQENNNQENTHNQMLITYKHNFTLHSLVNQNDINLSKQTNWNINVNKILTQFSLPEVWKIEQIKWNYLIKFNGVWFSLWWYSKLIVNKQDLNYWLKQADKYKPDIKLYYLNWNKYTIYLLKKDNIKSLYPFDPTKSWTYNANLLNKAWYIYFSNFLYKKTTKTNKYNIITAWISKVWNKLYFIVLSWKWSYIPLLWNNFYQYIWWIKKWSILINNWNNFITAWNNWVKYYYLWTYNLYKNINLKDLWDVLYSTFYRIWKYNLPYNVSYLYNLLKFANNFNNKKLSDAYKYIAKNIKYSQKVNNLINKSANQEELDKKLDANKSLLLNWDLFYSFQNKVWVCQTISDLLSFVSIINWLNADKVSWIIKKDWYLHQISKINNYYYDPTFDWWYLKAWYKWLRYFGMTEQQVSKYLQLTK